jgi:hypothetical protein
MVDMTNQSSAGPSAWERDLFAHVTSHVEAESGLLKEYSAVAQQTESKAFGYLVNLLIDDEIRHHRIFTQLAESIRTVAELGREEPIIPYMDFHRADPAVVLNGARQLLEREEQDARELKRLQREMRDVKDTSLWSLLVDLMQRDTQKHIAILRFVKAHAN